MFFFQLKGCANIWSTRLQRSWLHGLWRILTRFRQQRHNLINVVCCCEMEFWLRWCYEMQFDLVSTCHQRFSGILLLFIICICQASALVFLHTVCFYWLYFIIIPLPYFYWCPETAIYSILWIYLHGFVMFRWLWGALSSILLNVGSFWSSGFSSHHKFHYLMVDLSPGPENQQSSCNLGANL